MPLFKKGQLVYFDDAIGVVVLHFRHDVCIKVGSVSRWLSETRLTAVPSITTDSERG